MPAYFSSFSPFAKKPIPRGLALVLSTPLAVVEGILEERLIT